MKIWLPFTSFYRNKNSVLWFDQGKKIVSLFSHSIVLDCITSDAKNWAKVVLVPFHHFHSEIQVLVYLCSNVCVV